MISRYTFVTPVVFLQTCSASGRFPRTHIPAVWGLYAQVDFRLPAMMGGVREAHSTLADW